MPKGPVDPARLEGAALTNWYRRSPQDIEQARQAIEAQRYSDFFNPPPSVDPDPGFRRGSEEEVRDIDPGFSRGAEASGRDVDPGFSWIPAGPNRWRGDRAAQAKTPMSWSPDDGAEDAYLDRSLAGPDDGGEFIEIDGKARSQRRQWERREGQDWPTTESGRNYDRSHIIPKADGGPDTVDNIRPQHPDEHRAEHMAKGDFARWGARGARARTPAPPKGGPKLRGFGLLGIIPNITGILSGRIRTDTPLHFWSDMGGVPSPDDAPWLGDPNV
jgi:hypothetical protein